MTSSRHGMSADVVFPLADLRIAERLVEQARRGELAARAADVLQHARVDPRRITTLVLALAHMVAEERPPVETTVEKHLREAHAAWARGERADWVALGEREYQRDKKRRQRRRERWLERQSARRQAEPDDQSRTG